MRNLIAIFFIGFVFVANAQNKDKTLVTINDNEITVGEFQRVYEKNLDAIDDEDAKDVEKNLELFINYKLKVKEAYASKLDTLPSYQKEIETYRLHLICKIRFTSIIW